jgi:hypothetical protein
VDARQPASSAGLSGAADGQRGKGCRSRINRKVDSIEILMKDLFDFLSTLEFRPRFLNVSGRVPPKL